MWCVADIHNDTCHTCKRILRFKRQQIFMKLPQISHIYKNHNFLRIGNWWTNCFYPINLWQGHVRNLLFHFCQLWAVKLFVHQSCYARVALCVWSSQMDLDAYILSSPSQCSTHCYHVNVTSCQHNLFYHSFHNLKLLLVKNYCNIYKSIYNLIIIIWPFHLNLKPPWLQIAKTTTYFKLKLMTLLVFSVILLQKTLN